MERKYLDKGNFFDGPVTIDQEDDVACHAEMIDRLDDTTAQRQLRGMPEHALRNLAIRSRNQLAGTYERIPVNSESRKVGADELNPLASVRLQFAAMFPLLKRTSAEFNRVVATAMREAKAIEEFKEDFPDYFGSEYNSTALMRALAKLPLTRENLGTAFTKLWNQGKLELRPE